MPDEGVGIVMSLYDKVSPTLKSIGNNTKAFDKTMQELERSCEAYEKTQKRLGAEISTLKTKLAESSDKVKDATAAWKKHKDELTKNAMSKAIAEQTEWKEKLRDTEAALNSQRKAVINYSSELRKAENRAGGTGGAAGGLAGFGKQLAASGILQSLTATLGDTASTLLSSAIGEPQARAISNTISGALSGAAAGAVAGVPGAIVGGLLGAAVGGISGGTEIFKAKDDAFKSYVQENAEAQLSARDSDIQSGSGIAAQREQDAIAFNRLLGEGKGDEYLSQMRGLAAETPLEYGDLTGMSRSLATGFKDDPERMLGLMRSIGDAGSAVGVDASGMNMMATAMSRMQASGKVTLEYLNLIQERGVDAVGMLSEGLGKSKSQIYDLISKGKLDGVEAVQVLQDKMDAWYGGAMERQSKTFAGRSSTLSDAEKEMQNAYGEGYNEQRSKGIQDQINWLSGASGEAQEEANRAIGAWQAELENSKEEHIRKAVNGAMETDEYQKAKAEGDAAEMGRIIMAAKVKGQNEYNKSEGAQEALASELALAETIRDDADSDEAFYDAGFRKSQQFSKGLGAGIAQSAGEILSSLTKDRAGWSTGIEPPEPLSDAGHWEMTRGKQYVWVSDTQRNGGVDRWRAGGYAWGLDRVPYDNFPALLHEGERVLTAREARAQDGAGGGVSVTFTGPITVDSKTDLDALAAKLARKIMAAKVVRAPV